MLDPSSSPSASPSATNILRRFANVHKCPVGALTLRLHRGDWRRWTGTHYAVMEDDALRAEVYDFLSKVNYEKFDPEPKHVNAVLDGVKVTCSPTCPRL